MSIDVGNVSENRKLSILSAEDNLLNQKVLELVLRPLGADNLFVENGERVVEAYTSAPDSFDVILMDIMMPKLSGHDAARAIRDFESTHQLSEVPIIAISANALPADFEASLGAGCDAHIAKPYSPDDLYRIINDCLLKKRAA